jgi:hypothetical protein
LVSISGLACAGSCSILVYNQLSTLSILNKSLIVLR